MSECRLTMPTDRNRRGRGAWCIEHEDWSQDLVECRAASLTKRAEKAEAQVKAARDVMKCEEDCGATAEFVHVWSDPAMRTYACAAHRCSGCVLLDGAK